MAGGSKGKLGGLSGANKPAPSGGASCQQHWVAAKVRFKDDKRDVPSVDAVIEQGGAVKNAGPVAGGVLKSTGLPAGGYEFSLTDVHPDEWHAE